MYLEIIQLVFITIMLPLGLAILMANGVFKLIDFINPENRVVSEKQNLTENIEKEIFDSSLKVSTNKIAN